MSEQLISLQVQTSELLAGGIYRVICRAAKLETPHLAGQYLLLNIGDDWLPFSIASIIPAAVNAASDDALIELHIKSNPAKQDESFRQVLAQGSALSARYPFGDCVLPDSGVNQLLLIAGGTGFSQIKAILEAALEQGISKIALLWLAKEPFEFYLKDWLEAHPKKSAFNFVPLVLDHTKITQEEYQSEFLDAVNAQNFQSPSDVTTYIAGAPPMVKLLADYLRGAGFNQDKIRSDVFDLCL